MEQFTLPYAGSASSVPPRDISGASSARVSRTLNVAYSTSPTHSYHQLGGASWGVRVPPGSVKQLKPFATEDIKVLLLENVNLTGIDMLTAQGYQVEALKGSLGEDELIEKIK